MFTAFLETNFSLNFPLFIYLLVFLCVSLFLNLLFLPHRDCRWSRNSLWRWSLFPGGQGSREVFFFCALTWTKLIQPFTRYIHLRIWSALCHLQISIWASKNKILDSNLPPKHRQLRADLSWCSQTPSKGCDQKHKTDIFLFDTNLFGLHIYVFFFLLLCAMWQCWI